MWEIFGFQKKRGAKRVVKFLENGKKALQNKQFSEAFENFSQAATLGSVEAQFLLGQAYLNGVGNASNLKEGALWVEAAASSGWPEAQFLLAALYLQGLPEHKEVAGVDILFGDAAGDPEPDLHKSIYWAQKGAESNSSDAQALYGYLLSSGPEEYRDKEAAIKWYDQAIEQDCIQGYLGKGLLILREGKNEEDYAQAAALLEKAAKGKMGSAIYTLGVMYETGKGVAVDLKRAVELYKEAAEMGIREAQALYGVALRIGKGDIEPNLIQAETWLRRAALQGDIEAAVILGDMNGRGNDQIPPNYIEAARWYRFASEKGHAGAARSLGLQYLSGLGVSQSVEEAVVWLQYAAERGDSSAMAHLGNLVLKYPDIVSTQGLIDGKLRSAAEEGDPLSAFNLAVFLLRNNNKMDPEENLKKESEARFWMEKASEKVVNARFWYGRMLIEGVGGEKDLSEGCKWLQDAAQNGMVDAQILWAAMLLEGKTVDGEVRPEEALKLYQAAADQNNVSAMFSLAAMYGGGNKIAPDLSKAQAWFEKAAHGGHAMAQFMLGHYLAYGVAGHFDVQAARQWLLKAKEAGVEKADIDLTYLEQIEQTSEVKEQPSSQDNAFSESQRNWSSYKDGEAERENIKKVEVAPGLFFVKKSEN